MTKNARRGRFNPDHKNTIPLASILWEINSGDA